MNKKRKVFFFAFTIGHVMASPGWSMPEPDGQNENGPGHSRRTLPKTTADDEGNKSSTSSQSAQTKKKLEVCKKLAETQAASGDYKGALATLHQALACEVITADEQQTFYCSAEACYEHLDDDDGRVANLLRLRPFVSHPMEKLHISLTLGELYHKRGQDDEAVAEYQQALSYEIGSLPKANLYMNIGDIYKSKKNWHEAKGPAIEAFKKGVEIYEKPGKLISVDAKALPNLLAKARLTLGTCYARANQDNEAFPYLVKSLEGPKEGHYLNQKDKETAFFLLSQIYLDRNSGHYNLKLGAKYQALGSPDFSQTLGQLGAEQGFLPRVEVVSHEAGPSQSGPSKKRANKKAKKKKSKGEDPFSQELTELSVAATLQSDRTEEAETGIQRIRKKLEGSSLSEPQRQQLMALHAETCIRLSNYYLNRHMYKEVSKLLTSFRNSSSEDSYTKKCKSNLEKAERKLVEKEKPNQRNKKKGSKEKEVIGTNGSKTSVKGKEPAGQSAEDESKVEVSKSLMQKAKEKAHKAQKAVASLSPEALKQKIKTETEEFARLQADRLLNWQRKVEQRRLASQSKHLIGMEAADSSSGRPKLGRTLSSNNLTVQEFKVVVDDSKLSEKLECLASPTNTSEEACRYKEIKNQLETTPSQGAYNPHFLPQEKCWSIDWKEAKGQGKQKGRGAQRLLYRIEGNTVKILGIFDTHEGTKHIQ